MPFVSIKIARGRTTEQKRALAATVTEAIAASIDIDPKKVWIEIDEFELENFAVDGQLMIDRS